MAFNRSLLKKIKWYTPPSQQGSITVVIAFLLPVMLLMVALIVNINQLVFSKIKLQNTVDACALSAAAVQAAGLNEIADLNHEMAKEHSTASRLLRRGAWRSYAQARKACNFFYNKYGTGVINYIRSYQDRTNRRYAKLADQVARHVKKLNFPQSNLIAKRTTNALTTLRPAKKTIRFRYYAAYCDPEKCRLKKVLLWRDPGRRDFKDRRNGIVRSVSYRTWLRRRSFSPPERVRKSTRTYVDYEISLTPGRFLLADKIFGGVPHLKARAAAKPAGGHVYEKHPDYTAVLIR